MEAAERNAYASGRAIARKVGRRTVLLLDARAAEPSHLVQMRG